MSDGFAIAYTDAERRIEMELRIFEDDGHLIDQDAVGSSDGKLTWPCRKVGCHYRLVLEIGTLMVDSHDVELCVRHIHQPGRCLGEIEEEDAA